MENKDALLTLNKFLADGGVCSRRAAVELIKDGKIQVNGKVVEDPAYRVKITDKVKYNERYVKLDTKKFYVLLNKPKNAVTTVSDPLGRRTVLDVVQVGPLKKIRMFPIGRLDKDTTGVLLLTNDGEFAQRLAHPSNKISKVYHVTLNKEFLEKDLAKLKAGIRLADGTIKPDRIFFLKSKKSDKSILSVQLHSGKNRIIKRMFEKLRYRVSKLDRVSFAGITKVGMKPGEFRKLTANEMKKLV
jgi:23S rRNA pseudouridine2605 synthase